jgi:hypothetical protein
MKGQLYLDCDGVLADFDGYSEQIFGVRPVRDGSAAEKELKARMRGHGSFYRDLPLMPDARRLYEAVEHVNPVILTGCPGGGWAESQKQAWAAEHFPGVRMITCKASEKRRWCKRGDVLVDDYLRYADRWRQAGGIFLHHVDTETTLARLIVYEALFEFGIWPMPAAAAKRAAGHLCDRLGVSGEAFDRVRREVFCAALV